MSENPFELLFGEKGGNLCKKMFSLHTRFPKLVSDQILKHIGSFLACCSDNFLFKHNNLILSRIFLSYYRYLQTTYSKNLIELKILQIDSTTFGIFLAASSTYSENTFDEKNILREIQNLIPGVKAPSDSYVYFSHKKLRLFYLEIKKNRGEAFSSQEKRIFRQKLFARFQEIATYTSHSLSLPGNEEELFKNIRHLSHELKYVRDLPQVMISFVEYLPSSLKFLVIVLRLIKPDSPTILSLSSHLSSAVQFSLENIFCLGNVRQYPKEASVFTLEIPTSLFLRNNQSVNLRIARQYIVKEVESIIGPFRDYNGGLLNKENEQLNSIKNTLESKGIHFPFLEDFFYSIRPIFFRVIISSNAFIKFISLFQKISEKPLDGNSPLLEVHRSSHVHIAIVKTNEESWKSTLVRNVLPLSSLIGFSTIEKEDFFYFCFFYQNPTSDLLFDSIQNVLTHDSFTKEKRAILRLNFQAGEPSSLNPRLAHDIHSHILSNLLFEGLTKINQNGAVELAAAEKVETSGLSYTFYLRPAFWSNGERVTAYHFEKAWKKALISGIAGRLSLDFFSCIKNAKKVRDKVVSLEEVGIVAKNERTLCIELESPLPHFLNLISTPPFFPLFGESEEPSVFNGPFSLAQWNHDVELYLSKNPFYRDSNSIKLSGIKISMIRDPFKAYELFQKGELDLIGDPTSPLPIDILRLPEVQSKLLHIPVSRVFWIHCNTHIYPLHNENVRKALSLAIDRNQLVERVFINQIPQLSPLPYKYSQVRRKGSANEKKALEYLKKALKELGIKKEKFPALTISHSDLSFDKPLMKELQRQWQETLGITIIFKPLTWNEFSAALERQDFQLSGLFRRDLYSDPMFYLSFLKSSSFNPHSWGNAEYESLLKLHAQEMNKRGYLKKIEELLIEKAPIISLISQKYQVLINKKVKDIKWNDNGCLELKEARIDE